MDEDIKNLIEKNTKLVQSVFEQNQKIKHRITMMVIGSYLRLLLIVVPIIFAVIYLPPLLRPMFEQYSALLGGMGGTNSGANQIQDILKAIGK